jgi:hypothetical protein
MQVYVVIQTAVTNPDDDSPSSEGDDPIVSLAVYGLESSADSAAKDLYETIVRQHTDQYNRPTCHVDVHNGLPEYVVTTSFNIYRVSVSRLDVKDRK